ncbi:PiggyBac transposable element-derived protein 4 [Plakobranchus ocellatus]|uniref:PiggyBac transposable element-derived protein 4 n=1 Tax=Plakobranchus ocellatus TaxID=259542 RepID=A0AAV4AKP7_9GAST|nr:PiggyBac transposable element-derived protein 4 [Plakobranchus ocellatus]
MHVSKNGKGVLFISSMHHDGSIDEGTEKAEINVFYNKTKGGVDSLDQKVHSYMTKRQTVRWPLTFLRNRLDITAIAAYICFTAQNPHWNANKKHRRSLPGNVGRLALLTEL